MRKVAAMLLMSGAAHAQDARTLAWKFAEGDKAAVSWSIVGRAKVVVEGKTLLSYDFTQELSGKLSVASILRDGRAECLVSPRKHELKGKVRTAPFHLLVEDGAVVEAKGFDTGKKDLRKIAVEPIWLKVAPNGSYAVEGSEEVVKFFANQDSVIGPDLPSTALKAGDEWKSTLTLVDTKDFGMKSLTGTYRLVGFERHADADCAKIAMDETQDAVLKGVKVKNEIKREAFFDPAAGRCLKAKKSWRVSGSAELDGQEGSVDMDFTVEFLLEPIRK
jgi:hypothetical protein